MRQMDGRLEEAALLIAPPGRCFAGSPRRWSPRPFWPRRSSSSCSRCPSSGCPRCCGCACIRRRYSPRLLRSTTSGEPSAGLPLLLLSTAVATIAGLIGGSRFVTARRVTGATPTSFPGLARPVIASVVVVILVALVLPVAALAREASATGLFLTVIESAEAIVNSLCSSAPSGRPRWSGWRSGSAMRVQGPGFATRR